MSDPGLVSLVVPVHDEETNVAPLVQAVRQAMEAGPPWELLFVDDGSSDGTAAAVLEQAARDPRIRLIPLARNYGQTAAFQAGFDHSRGSVVVTLDGDLQNDPADIPALLGKIDAGFDLVAGYRLRRQDPWFSRRLPSIVANRIIQWTTGVPIRDNGCSLKAYRSDLAKRLSLYSDLHRFLPAVAVATAGARITEVPVRHHARRRGHSKYGASRILKVIPDLLTLKMIRSFRDRPLVLFGSAAVIALVAGVLFFAGAVLTSGRPEVTRAFVLPGAAALCLALAWYLLMLGLVGEIVVSESRAEHPEPTPLTRPG
jgi:glycosyltransferase involved in cell wall biosynthesis